MFFSGQLFLELSKSNKILPIPTLINDKYQKGVKFQIRPGTKGGRGAN